MKGKKCVLFICFCYFFFFFRKLLILILGHFSVLVRIGVTVEVDGVDDVGEESETLLRKA